LFKVGKEYEHSFLDSKEKWNSNTNDTRRHFRKSLTYTYYEDGEAITKTIGDVEVTIKETRYGKACNVICQEDLTQNEVMAIIRMFL
jgi:hypothetical protein